MESFTESQHFKQLLALPWEILIPLLAFTLIVNYFTTKLSMMSYINSFNKLKKDFEAYKTQIYCDKRDFSNQKKINKNTFDSQLLKMNSVYNKNIKDMNDKTMEIQEQIKNLKTNYIRIRKLGRADLIELFVNKTELNPIFSSIDKINNSIDEIKDKYVTQKDFDDDMNENDEIIKKVKKDFNKKFEKSNIQIALINEKMSSYKKKYKSLKSKLEDKTAIEAEFDDEMGELEGEIDYLTTEMSEKDKKIYELQSRLNNIIEPKKGPVTRSQTKRR
tara:strand:+ start:504 stop:1328 length:825 start_codon:yes stop_codon:yes gene_type:complete